MATIYWARDVWAVHTMLTVRCWQPEPANSWFGDNAHRRLRSVCCTCETDGKINLNEIYHLICCYLINFFLTGYVFWMWVEPNGAVCEDARVKSRPSKGSATVRWQPRSTLCGMFVQPFYFVSYYFYWIKYDDFFFHFQETYNSRLRERYGDDPSTHPDFDPDLLMEVGSSGGPDKIRLYGLSNTTAENLRAARSVSIVGSSQSVSSNLSKEFVAL
jgi:hypothetical protein